MKMKRRQKSSDTGPWRRFLQRRGGGLMLLVGVMLAIAWGVRQLQDPQVLPVRVVGIDGEIRYLERSQLERTVAQAVQGNFFSVDLLRVRAELERLPWVDRVTIRRVWPHTLKVRVVEQQPLARWGEDALINPRGEIFRPQPLPPLRQLAMLLGETRDAVRISREYQRIRALLQTVNLEPVKVRVDARQAWELQTREGLTLDLGRNRIIPRLTRFVRLYPRLKEAQQARLKRVDLRYTNGLSARWAVPETQTNRDDPSEAGHASRLAGI